MHRITPGGVDFAPVGGINAEGGLNIRRHDAVHGVGYAGIIHHDRNLVYFELVALLYHTAKGQSGRRTSVLPILS
ncbi:hypothetical protein ACE3MQ_15620 [Paenibacillus lentus]